MSLIRTLLFSRWPSMTAGGFPLEWLWKLPGEKKNYRKGKNTCVRDRVVSRFWRGWSPCLWCRREMHAASVTSLTWPMHCSKPAPVWWDSLQPELQRRGLPTASMQCRRAKDSSPVLTGTIWTPSINSKHIHEVSRGSEVLGTYRTENVFWAESCFGKPGHSLRNLNGSRCELTFSCFALKSGFKTFED